MLDFRNVIMLGLDVFDLYLIHKYMHLFMGKRRVNRLVELLAYLVSMILLQIVSVVAYYPIVNMLVSILGYCLIGLCYEGKSSKRMLTVFYILLCNIIAEIITSLIVGIMNFELFGSANEETVLSKFIIQVVSWLLTLIVARAKNIKENENIPLRITVASVIVAILSVFVRIFIIVQDNVSEKIIIVTMLVNVFINLTMIYLYDSLSYAFNRIIMLGVLKREKLYYHRQSEMLKNNYDELRTYRHDMQNRLCAMEQMLDDGKTEEIKKYLAVNIKKLNSTRLFSQTGNIAIDSVINYKLSMAQEKEINVEASATSPETINIEEDDLIVLIGNLLDNAIEATEKLEDEKRISLNLEYEKSNLILKIVNTYNGIIKENNGKFETTKADKKLHGIGTKSVDDIIEKYNGDKKVSFDDKKFEIRVILYT